MADKNKKSLGLALGGGGLKGLAHIGVLQILTDAGIEPQYLAGTSAGSLIAALYASGVNPYQMEAMIKTISPRDYLDYDVIGVLQYICGFFLPAYRKELNGMMAGKKLEQLVYKLTGGRSLQEAKQKLAIMACNIDTGQQVIFTNQGVEYENEAVVVITNALLSEAVRCSTAIPAAFQPRLFQGMKMVDGGLKDMVPARALRIMGAEYILAINLSHPVYKNPVHGIPEIASRSINILTYETSDAEERLFADMLLFPGVGDVSLDDLSNADRIIRMGRRIMKENILELIEALKGGNNRSPSVSI